MFWVPHHTDSHPVSRWIGSGFHETRHARQPVEDQLLLYLPGILPFKVTGHTLCARIATGHWGSESNKSPSYFKAFHNPEE